MKITTLHLRRAVAYLSVLLLFTVTTTAVQAQSDLNTTKDDQRLPVGSINTNDTRDRLVIEFVHNNWLDKPDDIKTKWHSRGLNFFFMYDVPMFKSNNISIAPGIGLQSANVYHDAYIAVDTVGNTLLKPIPDNTDWRKNKLETTYLTVPVELRLRTNPDARGKTFKVGLGFRASYAVSGKIKYKGDHFTDIPVAALGDDEVFYKLKKLPNLNPLQYGPTLRIGYGNFNLVGYYSLNTLFEEDKGPELKPISIGISFNSL